MEKRHLINKTFLYRLSIKLVMSVFQNKRWKSQLKSVVNRCVKLFVIFINTVFIGFLSKWKSQIFIVGNDRKNIWKNCLKFHFSIKNGSRIAPAAIDYNKYYTHSKCNKHQYLIIYFLYSSFISSRTFSVSFL